MKKTIVTLALDPETVNQNLNKIREFKDLYLQWCVDGTSPADDDPSNMLTLLRDFDTIDKHFLMLEHKIYNQQNREKGEPIIFPEVE